VASSTPGKEHSLRIEEDAEWASGPVWKRWRREKNPTITPARN